MLHARSPSTLRPPKSPASNQFFLQGTVTGTFGSMKGQIIAGTEQYGWLDGSKGLPAGFGLECIFDQNGCPQEPDFAGLVKTSLAAGKGPYVYKSAEKKNNNNDEEGFCCKRFLLVVICCINYLLIMIVAREKNKKNRDQRKNTQRSPEGPQRRRVPVR